MKIAKIEWRLRAVTRYLLTRYEEPVQPDGGSMRYGTHVMPAGEYDSLDLAVDIGLALTSMDGKKHPDVPVRFDDINLPAPKVRAKMTCHAKTAFRDSDWAQDRDGGNVMLTAVYESGAADGGNAALENRIFSKATPNATIQMHIENPEAFARFERGRSYYVDFIPVPAENELQSVGEAS